MAIPLRLLIAMSSEDDALLIVRQLQHVGYDLIWYRVDSATALAEKLTAGPWDVIISDYAIPGFGGLEALEMVRQQDQDLPFIILSGGIGEKAAVESIKAGAGDCILRDDLDRLPAAVEREVRDSELRRSRRAAEAEKIAFYDNLFAKAHEESVVTDLQARIKDCNKALLDIIGMESIEGALGLLKDISDQKTANLALEKSERLYRLLTENANDVIWSCDLGIALQYVSPSVEKLLGWTPDEVLVAGITMTLPPESLRLAAEKLQVILAQYGSNRRVFEPVIFEIEQNRKDGTRIWTEVSARPFLDGEGRMAGISGVTRDISERKKAEKALLRAEKEWARTFDRLPDLIAVLDDRHRILRANQAMAERLGLTPGQCIGRTCYESVHGTNEPIASCPHARNLADGQEHTAEFHEERLGGDFLVSCMALYDEQGVRIGAVHIARDITERKHAEEALRHAHERLQRFVDANIMGVIIASPSGDIIEANDYYLRTIGYTREEFKQGIVDWRAITPPEWLPADERAIEELRQWGTCKPYEKEYVRRDGTRVSIFLSDAMLPGPEEQIAAFILDITDRKQAENALRESERRFSAMLSNVDLISLMLDRDARVTFCNDYLLRLTGWRREEVIGSNWFDLFIPPEHEELKRTFTGLLNDLPVTWHRENEILTRSGKRRLIRWNNSVLYSISGEAIGTASIGEDITERKRMEEELKESEQRFRMVVENAPDAIFVRSVSGHFVYLNHAAVSLFGAASADQLIGKHISEHIPPDEYAISAKRIKLLNEGQAVPVIEQTFLRMDISPITLEVSAVPLRYEGMNGALTFARDISERKQAEQALRESERRHRSLFENMLSGYAYCKMLFDDGSPHDFTYIDVNSAFEELTGLKNVIGKKVSEVIPGIRESNPELLQTYGRVARTGKPERFETYVEPLGQWFSVSVYSPEKGYFVAVFDVITDRKLAQGALQEAHNRLDQIIEYLPDATFVIDADRNVIAWNRAIEKMTGISKELMIGKGNYEYAMPFYGKQRPTLVDLVLLPDEELEKGKYDTVHRIADTLYGEAFAPQVYEGKGAYFSATASRLRDASGNIVGAIETIRDVTNQKKAEAALKEALGRREELEAIISQSPIMVVLYRMESGFPVEYVSESVAQYGYQPEDFTSGRISILGIIHPDDSSRVVEEARMHLQRGYDDITQDYRIRTAWGNYQWVLNRTRMRRDRNGRVTHGQSVIHDITDRKRAEIALQESERQMRALLDNIPDIVWLKDAESRFISANESFGKACGVKPTEIAGKTDLDLWPTELAEAYRADDQDVMRSGGTKRIVEPQVDATGRKTWMETFKTPIRNDRGDIIGTTGIARDITERKRVEDLYRMLSDKSLAGVYVVQDGIFKYLNANAASYAGYRPEELVGRASAFLLHDGDKALARKHAGEMLRGVRQTPYEFRIIDKAGNTRWILETVTTIPYEGKSAVLGNSMDISQIKEAQRKLEDLKALESSILATIPHAVMGIKNRRIIFANEGVEIVFGWKREELINQSTRILFRSDEAYKDFGAALYATLEKEKTVSGEYDAHFQHKEGRNLICRVTASRIGETLTDKYITTTIEDVTNLRSIQMQLLQSEKMSSIGQLAAGVAHEINNPTGYVSSNLKTLEEYFDCINSVLSKHEALLGGVKEGLRGRLSPESLSDQADAIESVKGEVDLSYIMHDVPNLIQESRQGTERIRNIVIDLKNFAHPGKAEFELADIVKNIESTLNVVWNELKYKATIHKDYGELPPIMCIPQQLNQVFMNLLVNAAHAIKDKGDITIRTRRQDGHVEVSIQDTGCGIPAANISKVFDPFFTTKEVGKGTGLGLNVAYNIVKKHRGTIDVTSKVGEGTTFTILLPVNQEEGKA